MATLLAVGTQKGLFCFRSSDGEHFELDAHHLPGWEVSAVLLRPAAAGGVDFLAGTSHYAYGPVTRRSRDNGATWAQPEGRPAHASGSSYKNNRIWQLTADPHSPALYAGIDEAALFRSDDDGETWHENEPLTNHPTRPQWQPGGGGLCLHTIVHDHSNPDRMWLGISAVGAWRTLDRGKTWTTCNTGIASVATGSAEPSAVYCVHKIVQHPTRSDSLYMQFHGGVYATDNGGDSWEARESGLPGNFGFPMVALRDGTLVIAPLTSDEKRYFPDGNVAVYRSTDEGRSWQAASAGTRSYSGVLRDAMAVSGKGGVYFGTMSGDVATSADAGQSWRTLELTLPRVLCVRAMEV